MIILYSITGIISALFLVIIVTGAVRAHRYPERYGPRRVVGRARQSRAKGIAKAMLDTIPIVKFGGEPNVQQATTVKGDVELAVSDDVQDAIRETGKAAELTEVREAPTDNEQTNTSKDESGEKDKESGNSMCPICTDDFVKGQDIRVLPCNHQYHPECVDPWLVNVSGTCPLW